MLFDSFAFIGTFLPLTLLFFFVLGRLRQPRLASLSLLLASLIFYGIGASQFLPVLLASIAVNFALGQLIQSATPKMSRVWLWLGVGCNLLALGFFKYSGWLVETLNAWQLTGIAYATPRLPTGISFFTFTQIAYLVDLSRRTARVEPIDRYALFVTFFPHLVAGPILHHRTVMPQLAHLRTVVFSHKNVARGLAFFVIGLFKKVVIADSLAPTVNLAFTDPHTTTAALAWLGIFSYSLQLYFDFSGYSDMAVGLALMLNIQIPFNFDSPYQARSIIDFWRRWHMSLSAFLRDYLYIPLGGNRLGPFRRYLNLLLTMMLGGLWHGANLTFVLWGTLHGIMLIINHLWRQSGLHCPDILARFLTLTGVFAGWLVFRAANVYQTTEYIQALSGANGMGDCTLRNGLTIVLLMGVVLFLPNSQTLILKRIPRRQDAFVLASMFALSCLLLDRTSEFLYYQF